MPNNECPKKETIKQQANQALADLKKVINVERKLKARTTTTSSRFQEPRSCEY
jgi:metal-sulfur cluster biosynthetic enzyme